MGGTVLKKCLVVATPEVGDWPYALLTGSFEEKIRKAAELGYDGVELLIRDIKAVDQAMVKATIRRHGLTVPALVTGVLYGLNRLCLISPDPEISRRAMTQLQGFLDFAGNYGAVVDIGLLRGRLDQMPDPSAARTELVERFRQTAEYATHVGARVTLEPLNRYEADIIHNAQEGLCWVAEVDHPSFGLMLDTFHMNIEDASMEGSLREAAPKLWHMHISDSNRLSPGRGHLDFVGMFQVLREEGYQGYVSAEQLALPDPDTAAATTIRYLNRFG
jgi:sugar phosphate isomerase/epimerase